MSKRKKQLAKSNDKVISGVLGGVAEYFDWDKTITRLIAVVLCVFPGHVFGGILIYLIAAVVMPDADDDDRHHDDDDEVIEGEFREK
ncbi:PspC domain-containing protein [Ligilactobacillus sp.]|uniref:PspC domain-containing protein n=1 Tax=Ligilactobacillus sp. TaxID=2767921 RepID=UPI002FE114DB